VADTAQDVTCSIGWIGAVLAFLGLTVIGMTSQDPATARGAYLVMEPAARYVLVPVALASLLTGSCRDWAPPGGCSVTTG
jgi:hypothetical protein